MVLAGRRGDPRLGESERRLGMMRIATKYPRIAERHFEGTGRQVEVIEVKGSVELAPLIGLGDGIVDLVATGRTLEENDLEVREEIVECTARFVANRVSHKLRSREVDELTSKLRPRWSGDEDEEIRLARRRPGRRRRPRLDLLVGGAAGRRGDRGAGRARRRQRRAAPDRRARRDRVGAAESLRVDRTEQTARRSPASIPACARSMEVAAANIRAVAAAQVAAAPTTVELAPGPRPSRSAKSPSAPPGSTPRAAAPPIPQASSCARSRPARPASAASPSPRRPGPMARSARRRSRRQSSAAWTRSMRWAARRRSSRSPTAPSP